MAPSKNAPTNPPVNETDKAPGKRKRGPNKNTIYAVVMDSDDSAIIELANKAEMVDWLTENCKQPTAVERDKGIFRVTAGGIAHLIVGHRVVSKVQQTVTFQL